jgi:hypothetical protein
MGAWFRGEFSSVIDPYILSDRALGRGLLEPNFVRDLVRRHQNGREVTQNDCGRRQISRFGSTSFSMPRIQARERFI